jgi:hypothetical protein
MILAIIEAEIRVFPDVHELQLQRERVRQRVMSLIASTLAR